MPPATDRLRGSVSSGLAGAGGGTGLLALVQSLDDHAYWKPVLIFLAPTATVVIAEIWFYAKQALNRYVHDRTTAFFINSTIRKAIKERDTINTDPHASEEHKLKLQKDVEMLQANRSEWRVTRSREILKK